MDPVIIPAARLEAGRVYLTRLRQLGLDPEGVFWGQWDEAEEPNLLIVTSVLDRVGPLRLNEMLIRAYNAAVLPREISPFCVELHSPAQSIFRWLMDATAREPTASVNQFSNPSPNRHPNVGKTQLRIGSLTIPLAGLYHLDASRIDRAGQYLRWNRFRREVETAVAAAA